MELVWEGEPGAELGLLHSDPASMIERVIGVSTVPEAELERAKTREERYRLGQFFTPPLLAEFLAEAVREAEPETVLDPGVGGGVLLRAVGPGPKLYGLDIDRAAVELASASLDGAHELAVGDFLDPANWLLWCHESKEPLAGKHVLRYIEHGESLGLPDRFNCRSRSPWYSVERVEPPDYFVT